MLVDWLPWNHTFGGNHNFGLVLYNGGSLYIDEGKPMPGAIEATCATCATSRRPSTSTCPRASRCCCHELEADRALSRKILQPAQGPVLCRRRAAAARAATRWRELAAATTGERIIFLSSLGSTETAPSAIGRAWDAAHAGNIGLPLPGVELKLVPGEGKFEARLKGANITPGYWRAPALTAAAFDDEGYYRIGDALKFEDPDDPAKGLVFDGRLAEDFKLATGTWVSVGPLRAGLIALCAPFVRDAVLAAPDRDEVAALIFPDIEACRKLAPGLAPDAPASAVLADSRVRARFAALLAELSASGRGTSARVRRAILLVEPPSLDVGEITDKGSINQRAVLAHRTRLVDELYADPPPPRVIVAGRPSSSTQQAS